MSEDLLENETVKLRIIELEYTYRNAFDTTDKAKLDQAKQILKQMYAGYILKKHVNICRIILTFIHQVN
ncbi:hypothetical protein [Amphibacillus jilinensis]|uniref:hypothetical protein n=1 Tax=Amphibacillus jilinensis TaxID=1216008 RepID=UPI0002DEFCAA|nr:hypothetical protein [Amphibacillus jilinensis]